MGVSEGKYRNKHLASRHIANPSLEVDNVLVQILGLDACPIIPDANSTEYLCWSEVLNQFDSGKRNCSCQPACQ